MQGQIGMDEQGAPHIDQNYGAVHCCQKQSTLDTGTTYHLKCILNF